MFLYACLRSQIQINMYIFKKKKNQKLIVNGQKNIYLKIKIFSENSASSQFYLPHVHIRHLVLNQDSSQSFIRGYRLYEVYKNTHVIRKNGPLIF